MEGIRFVCFDLFHTLISPKYGSGMNEYDIPGMTRQEWEFYAEDAGLYKKRASGNVRNAGEIIDEIAGILPVPVSEEQKGEILRLRKERMRRAAINVDAEVLEVLSTLKKNGKILCLISNADIIDTFAWVDSPLAGFFECTLFSHEVGRLKPEPEIYRLAISRLNAAPEQCVFIGDGGSDELRGAKEAGMHTLFTEYLQKKDPVSRGRCIRYADGLVSDFFDIIEIIK